MTRNPVSAVCDCGRPGFRVLSKCWICERCWKIEEAMGMHGPRISLNRFAGRRMRMNRAQTLDYESRSGDLPPICGESLKVLEERLARVARSRATPN